jgi:hypothetical protein
MLKRFFSAEIIRTPQSAEMYFTRKSISSMLGMTEKTIERRLSRLKYESLKGLRYDGKYKGRKHFFKYGLDAVLALIFTLPADDERRVIRYAQLVDFITAHISNLCFDEFTSLKGYHLPLDCRRAVIAHVCGVEKYTDLVLARFDPAAPYKGTMLRNLHCTPELLSQPEVYVTRTEVTRVKAVDLAVHLLCTHLVDTPAPVLLAQLGIDTSRGVDYTEQEKLNLIAHISGAVL